MEALKLFICDLYCKKTQESQAWLVPSQIKIENKTLLDCDYIDKEIGGRSCKCLVSFQIFIVDTVVDRCFQTTLHVFRRLLTDKII